MRRCVTEREDHGRESSSGGARGRGDGAVFFFFFPFHQAIHLDDLFDQKNIQKNFCAEETSAPGALFYRLLGPNDITPKLNGRKVKRERGKVERRKKKRRREEEEEERERGKSNKGQDNF